MNGGLPRALLLLTAVVVGAGCVTTRGAQQGPSSEATGVEGRDAGNASDDPFEQTHPEPDLEARIASAVIRRGGEADTGTSAGAGTVRHTVEPGQTVYRISVMNGITPEALMAANGISDPTTLKVGQVLVVPVAKGAGSTRPASASANVKTVPRKPAKPRPTALRDREPSATQGQLEWPLRGVLYARFGKKGNERHDGIDLAAPKGSPVYTAAPGIVLFAGEQAGYGLIVLVEHANGLITLYAHNASLTTKTGAVLKARAQVATVGESGRTSGPHLHFEVRQDGFAVDPLRFLGAVPPR